MTNTPLTVVDASGTSITVLSDDYGLGFGNAAGTSTQLVGIDNGDIVTFAAAISTLPAGDFLFLTSEIKQDRFIAGQAIAINKDLFKKCVANTSGSTIVFKRIYGSLKVTESKANVDAQLADSAGGGSGTVTTASVVSANGFTGTVANPTTTPAITVATSVTGLLKGNGTAVSAVVSGTDIKTVNGTSILGSGDLVVSGGYTEYNVAVASSSILIRVTGTASITAAKTNSSTITFTIPASGYLQAFDIYYPSGENPAGTTTLIFNYTSNSAFNQGFSTAKVAYIYGMSGTRIVGARNNSVDILIDATAASGNITHVLTTPAGLNTGDIKLFGSFA